MENKDTKELIQWHSGFRGAIKTELSDAKDILHYEDEKSIGKKELKIDLLIIKKTKNIKINNPIGHIFTKYNLLEYKSPDDYTPSPKNFQSIGHQNSYMQTFDVRFSENIKVTEYT